jgi:ketosteroid isomerase-like protein
MKSPALGHFRNALLLLTSMTLLFLAASPAAAQNDKKKKKKPEPVTDTGKPLLALGDEQQIDYMISDMLGAWQIGDIEKLRRDYADDVSVVNGAWAPPVVGWTNYLALYQQQRAHMSSVRMDRQDTYIKVNGTIGWAAYQWEFQGLMDGQETGARGQTTLVLEKRKDRWVIVHNHTSLIQTFQPPQPGATPAAPAAQPTKPATP